MSRTDAVTLLGVLVVAVALFAAICGRFVVRPAVDPTPTPIIQVRVIPESPVPATATMRDIFTVPTSSPELVWSTPLPTSTSTPEPTVAPTETPRPATPTTAVMRG